MSQRHSPYLDLDWPGEITDVHIKGNVGVASKGELFTRETVSVILDVCFGHNGHLLSRDCSSCWEKEFIFSTMPFSFQTAYTLSWGAAFTATCYYECINGFI